MELNKLKKGNELHKLMEELEGAMNCFEWYNPETPELEASRNPRLIVEYDDEEGGRSQTKIPMNLSDTLVTHIKSAIKTKMAETAEQFKNL